MAVVCLSSTSVSFPSLALLRLVDSWRMETTADLTKVQSGLWCLWQMWYYCRLVKPTGTLHMAVDLVNVYFSSCCCGKGIGNSSHSWEKNTNIQLLVCLKNMRVIFCNNIHNLKQSGHTIASHNDPLY